MNSPSFKIRIDVSDIARRLNTVRETIEDKIMHTMEMTSIAAHAYIKTLADTHFAGDEFKRKFYLGLEPYGKNASGVSTKDDRVDQTVKNLRWVKIVKGMWVVELDQQAQWLEEGRCVVYGTSPSHIPKVLTPSGFKKITKIKLGDLVLNQFGKWTEVLNIYDKKLTEESTLRMDVIEACHFTSSIKSKHKRKYINSIQYTCQKCNHKMIQNKFHQKAHDKKQCENCFTNTKLIKLSFNIGNPNSQSLCLTADHLVLTESGWVEAQHLDETIHKIFVPSLAECLKCKSPTLMYKKYCSVSCASSFNQIKLAKEGKHYAQSNIFASIRYKALLKLNSLGVSLSEERTVEHMRSLGYTVGFYGDKTESDIIRQYPIKKEKGYYYADFYLPKLNLVLEIDGKRWHNHENDTRRDNHLKSQGIDTIRFPSWRVTTLKFKRELESILANHEDRINFIPTSFKKEISFPSKCSGLTRRWDITVAEGNSFVCEGAVIHNSETFMGDWLLKPGAKGVKRAKDGSLYRVIPMKQTEGKADAPGAKPMFAQLVRNAAKAQNVNLSKIERHENGAPKIGVLHKLNIRPTYPQSVAPGDFSRPRTEAEALLSGLKPHSGIFKLQGAVVTQKEKKDRNGKILRDKSGHAKVSRSTVVFRVISSKHKAEGNRWMYPEVTPANFFGQAHRWAEEQMNVAIKHLEEELSR